VNKSNSNKKGENYVRYSVVIVCSKAQRQWVVLWGLLSSLTIPQLGAEVLKATIDAAGQQNNNSSEN